MDKIIAGTIFLLSYAVIASEKFPRYVVALLGAMVMVTVGLLDLPEAMAYVNWETIGLLFGMFILIAVLAEGGFFNWLALEIAERVHYKVGPIFIIFPLLAGFLSAFMDSITVLLFFSTLSYYVARAFKVSPIPLVIAEVCAANAGGAATLVGDPPNVILGTMLGFTFTDFARNTGPIALLSLLIIVFYSYLIQLKDLRKAPQITGKDLAEQGLVKEIKDKNLMTKGLWGMIIAVFILVIHRWLSDVTGLDVTAASAALIPALIVVILLGEKSHGLVAKIDLESLLFFIGLFVIVGGLEKTGVIDLFAKGMVHLAGPSHLALILILLWAGAILSAVIDNVPLALTMAYVLKDIANMPGAPALPIMVWALALGTDMGGNGTPIGASANVVAYSNLERQGIKIGWLRWMKLAIPPTVLALLASSLLLGLKLHYGFY